MGNLKEIFSEKFTENGDIAYTTTGTNLLDILFMAEYFSKHLDEVFIGDSEKEKLFSMFMRDPRYGLGYRDLGRDLMYKTDLDLNSIVNAGRFDDIFYNHENMDDVEFVNICAYAFNEIEKGNELAKKWMPRYSSKNLMLARRIAYILGMNKQQYGHFVKCDTTESKLSRKDTGSIKFEHVPSKAMLKYYKRFSEKEDTAERFHKYIEDVKSGKKNMNTAVNTVYDIYRNRENIDCDLLFSKIEKIGINCIPIVDTSGSMCDGSDSIGKALAIGHYLSKCSTYAQDMVIEFSSNPHLIKLGEPLKEKWGRFYGNPVKEPGKSQYLREISSMYTGDCSNTDLGAVMELLKKLDDMPEYLVILTDMEFDCGTSNRRKELEQLWKDNGYKTKIVWWNLNSRNKTVPEMDDNGNIYMSGYSPMMLKYLEVGFDGNKFLDKLLEEYARKISEQY